jgi:hypothetical protein
MPVACVRVPVFLASIAVLASAASPSSLAHEPSHQRFLPVGALEPKNNAGQRTNRAVDTGQRSAKPGARSMPHRARTASPPAARMVAAPETPEEVPAGSEPGTELPSDRDELFGLPPDQPATHKEQTQEPPGSRDELFAVPHDEGGVTPAADTSPGSSNRRVTWRGFIQEELAYTYADPTHWSKGLTRAQLSAQGALTSSVKWKLSARLDYDLVYSDSDFYPPEVSDDQEFNLLALENYLDVSAGDLELRLGRQQIVWGEMVTLFVADVVSARDLREFILPDFEILRIPQWAGRAEYFGGDWHAEAIWIPYPSYDEIGEPGSDFYPFPPPPPPGFGVQILDEEIPSHTLSNTNYGLRLSALKGGWDFSTFYYSSLDASPTFYRQVVLAPSPAFIYQARHDRIWQAGGTVAKDLRRVVLKGEAVYTSGRKFNVTRIDEPDGVVPQDTVDYILGLDFALPRQTRLNLQFFQRIYFDHDPDIIPEKYETGASVLLAVPIGRFEPQILVIQSFNRGDDRLVRPRVDWKFHSNWRLRFGVDVFSGPPLGIFGRYDNRDRVYAELRYAF